MSPSARPLDAAATVVIVILCLSWGLNQVAIKLAMLDIPPLLQGTIRSVGALALIAVWSRWRGVRLTARDGTLVPGLVAGALFGCEFVLIYLGMQFTTASRGGLFIYTAPFFVALAVRWVLPGEKLLPIHWVGLALSFCGVALAVGAPGPAADPRALLGDLMLIVAGAMWAATTLTIKASRLRSAPPEKVFTYQIAGSIPIFALGTWLLGERWPAAVSPASLFWLAYQTVWVVAVTYAIWYALIQRYSASRLSAFTFLTPLAGVAAGTLVLGEPITGAFAAAVGLVIAGLVLVNRQR